MRSFAQELLDDLDTRPPSPLKVFLGRAKSRERDAVQIARRLMFVDRLSGVLGFTDQERQTMEREIDLWKERRKEEKEKLKKEGEERFEEFKRNLGPVGKAMMFLLYTSTSIFIFWTWSRLFPKSYESLGFPSIRGNTQQTQSDDDFAAQHTEKTALYH